MVFRQIDQPPPKSEENGCTIVLDSEEKSEIADYHDTPLRFSDVPGGSSENEIPPRIRQMCAMYRYGRESFRQKCKNFYNQGMFMEDYKDDYPWKGDFFCYFPTYHDLTPKQLRGYFSWRTKVRKNIFEPISTSAAYLYLYELINGIGVNDPIDGLEKMKAFERGYLDTELGDRRMVTNLHRWMMEYSVINNISPEIARQYTDPKILQHDEDIISLRDSDKATDEAIFMALCRFGNTKLVESPVVSTDPARGHHLFAESWKATNARFVRDGKNFFTLCFGGRSAFAWYPLGNTVYYGHRIREYREYQLTKCRDFFCHRGHWYIQSYDRLTFDKDLLSGFLHMTDLKLRRYLKTGRYLKEKPEEFWVIPYIDAVIEADKKEVIEASRPKISIDLSGLDQIRRESLETCQSLLTEDQTESDDTPEAESLSEPDKSDVLNLDDLPECSVNEIQRSILLALLHGEDVQPMIKSHHLMPSVVADEINEALYDEIGDTVLVCENDKLSLVEDYIEDLAEILGEDAQ